MAETIFAQGMVIQERKPQTPEYVLGKFSFKADEFINTLNQHRNQAGWVNVVMMRSKGGKPYLSIDKWEPQAQQAPPQGGYAPPQTQGGYAQPQNGYQQPPVQQAPVQGGYQMPPQAAGAPQGTPPPPAPAPPQHYQQPAQPEQRQYDDNMIPADQEPF